MGRPPAADVQDGGLADAAHVDDVEEELPPGGAAEEPHTVPQDDGQHVQRDLIDQVGGGAPLHGVRPQDEEILTPCRGQGRPDDFADVAGEQVDVRRQIPGRSVGQDELGPDRRQPNGHSISGRWPPSPTS